MSDTERVHVGTVIKPHGLRGEVAVDLRTDLVEERFFTGAVLIGQPDGRAFTITSSRPHQGRLLVTFAGVSDRTEAEGLRGTKLTAEPIDLSDNEHYFAHELVGMPVVLTATPPVDDDDPLDLTGAIDLGEITALIELPDAAQYDLLEVRRPAGDGTWLLPVVDEYVEIAIDEDDNEVMVLIAPPEGLVPDDLIPDGWGV